MFYCGNSPGSLGLFEGVCEAEGFGVAGNVVDRGQEVVNDGLLVQHCLCWGGEGSKTVLHMVPICVSYPWSPPPLEAGPSRTRSSQGGGHRQCGL